LSHLSAFLRCTFACGMLLAAVSPASAQFPPNNNRNNQNNPAQYIAMFRAPLTEAWNKYAVEYDDEAAAAKDDNKFGSTADKKDDKAKKDGKGQKYIGYAEAFKLFGLTKPEKPWVPPDEAKKEEDKKEAAKKEDADKKESTSTSTSTADTKPAPKKKTPKKPDRIDVHFVDALDKDSDGKISKQEYDTWADSYAKAEAAAYAAELNALRQATKDAAQLAKAEAAAMKAAQQRAQQAAKQVAQARQVARR
jgi:hypothetical protein